MQDAPNRYFPSTAWATLKPGSRADSDDRRRATAALAEEYHGPIAAWLEDALGLSRDDAAEAAQEFFLWILESSFLAKADPARGSFRAFLKTALRNFVTDRHRHATRQRRGGNERPRSLDAGASEDGGGFRSGIVDAAADHPGASLDRAWRKEVIDRAFDRTATGLRDQGKDRQLAVFEDYVRGASGGADYAALAARHGVTTTDVTNWIARGKERFRAEIKAIVLASVSSEHEIDTELAWLLGGGP